MDTTERAARLSPRVAWTLCIGQSFTLCPSAPAPVVSIFGEASAARCVQNVLVRPARIAPVVSKSQETDQTSGRMSEKSDT